MTPSEEVRYTRRVLHTFATDKDDSTEDPRFGRVGNQTIEDTGPLTSERMKDFDATEVIPKALDFMKKSHAESRPFFVWLNTSRMHLYTHLNEKWRYAAEKYTHEDDVHGSGMLQHDHDIGLVLDFLDKNGLDGRTQSSGIPPTTGPNTRRGHTAARRHGVARR